ncbi:MAG: GNAT family N-acetyltransferase [Betaproteobacteria bacterium]|nr:MAG: GNAT family N-acetyltransferase [Betaproteobacteria bacterium]TMH07127.1 MAG: GNAT family N-acetyltransferase [Betaproteobacteria bacterium]
MRVASRKAPTMSVHVQRLTEAVRPRLLEHFLRLSAEDIRLRFGTTFGPSAIAQYVERIDFDNDAVLGVYDDELTLAGVVHVGFSGDSAELGLSILPGHRGRGVGSALFARAAEHARNRFVTRLYMHCLSENAAMMHIAKKSGMKICIDTGEADAFLKLPPADPASLTGEMFDQRLALFDYALKTQTAALRKITDSLGDPED